MRLRIEDTTCKQAGIALRAIYEGRAAKQGEEKTMAEIYGLAIQVAEACDCLWSHTDHTEGYKLEDISIYFYELKR